MNYAKVYVVTNKLNTRSKTNINSYEKTNLDLMCTHLDYQT